MKFDLYKFLNKFKEGHESENRTFSEEDWTKTDNKKVLPYSRSKTEAEKAAWEFVKNLKGN